MIFSEGEERYRTGKECGALGNPREASEFLKHSQFLRTLGRFLNFLVFPSNLVEKRIEKIM